MNKSPSTDDWCHIERGLRWLCVPPNGIIAIQLDTGKSHTRVGFSIAAGKLRSEGWSGDIPHIRKIALLLREAADDLEKSAEEWVVWHEKRQ